MAHEHMTITGQSHMTAMWCFRQSHMTPKLLAGSSRLLGTTCVAGAPDTTCGAGPELIARGCLPSTLGCARSHACHRRMCDGLGRDSKPVAQSQVHSILGPQPAHLRTNSCDGMTGAPFHHSHASVPNPHNPAPAPCTCGGEQIHTTPQACSTTEEVD